MAALRLCATPRFVIFVHKDHTEQWDLSQVDLASQDYWVHERRILVAFELRSVRSLVATKWRPTSGERKNWG